MGIENMRVRICLCCHNYSIVLCALQVKTRGIAEREGAEQRRTDAQSEQAGRDRAFNANLTEYVQLAITRCIAAASPLSPPPTPTSARSFNQQTAPSP